MQKLKGNGVLRPELSNGDIAYLNKCCLQLLLLSSSRKLEINHFFVKILLLIFFINNLSKVTRQRTPDVVVLLLNPSLYWLSQDYIMHCVDINFKLIMHSIVHVWWFFIFVCILWFTCCLNCYKRLRFVCTKELDLD